MKKLKMALLLGTLLAILLTCQFSSFAAVCRDIRADTLRLHILANSDSTEDQALKLYVRDCILKESAALFAQATTKEGAERAVDQNLALLQKTAERAIAEQGFAYPVKVSRTNLYFATTNYKNGDGRCYTLPAGRYDAVRVEIGKSAGHNWFCVLFPQLCLPAAEGEQQADALYTGKEKRVLEGEYEVRFALLEWLQPERSEPIAAPLPTQSPAPERTAAKRISQSEKS
ncbi:MAG: stage II sporulation protein R [Pygmaiobacter sp.]